MARSASLDASRWLPTYSWWPPTEDVRATVVLSPYHSAVDENARFSFTLRGYVGSSEPIWEYDLGEVGLSEQQGVPLWELPVPEPPAGHGGILEVHGVRLDEEPRKGVGFVGQWVDAETTDGGGYILPTIPIRGAAKRVQRDDLQVIPGICSGSGQTTELVLLNVVDQVTTVRLMAASPDGLTSEGRPFDLEPWSAWRGELRTVIPGLRRLLEPTEGIGSLAIYSSHRLLPYFAFRTEGGPILSLDHTAPIFA
jgi:hypothetical protein